MTILLHPIKLASFWPCLFLVLGTAHLALAQWDSHPNILLITADNLGLQVGCYGDALARPPLRSAGTKRKAVYQCLCDASFVQPFTQ